MEQVMKELTEQRVRLDAIKNAINELPASRGKALAYTSLEKGRMYVGEVLRELGKEYPYEATKKATDAKGIQEAADTSDTVWEVKGNEIVELNRFREVLEQEELIFLNCMEKVQNPIRWRNTFVTSCVVSEAWRGLKEARMWLGIRLGEIRDNANK